VYADLSASVFIVNIDNVSSQQCHMIRKALRGEGVVLMGKNTMVRRALRTLAGEFPQFEKVLPFVRGNIGFVFTNGDLKEIRETIVSNKVAAPARAGAVAPADVYVPAGNTGMEPGKTSFFQALGIPTKIARGTIEIVNDVQVVTAGSKVGSSEATLLNMLNISPFTYGMTVVQVYDNGAIFPPSILDIEEQTLIDQFSSGIKTIAAISLAIGIPTIASVAHSFVNAYKNVLAISIATDYEFEESAKVSRMFPSRHNHDVVIFHCRFLTSCARLHRRRRWQTLIHTLKPRTAGKPFLLVFQKTIADTITDQGVPCQPHRLRCRCPRRRCRHRGRPRRQGGGEGGVRGRRHGLRPLRLSVLYTLVFHMHCPIFHKGRRENEVLT
jgi:large subunit ribosomal protein LP0